MLTPSLRQHTPPKDRQRARLPFINQRSRALWLAPFETQVGGDGPPAGRNSHRLAARRRLLLPLFTGQVFFPALLQTAMNFPYEEIFKEW